MRIALGADHAGYRLKERIAEHLGQGDQGYDDILLNAILKTKTVCPTSSNKYDVVDFGTNSEDSVDYPDIGIRVAQAVRDNDCRYGILICGTGVGMSIVANKIHGIRAALCCSTQVAQACREHNDANILVLGARVIEPETAIEIVDVFLTTDFAGGRHERRIEKIAEMEGVEGCCAQKIG